MPSFATIIAMRMQWHLCCAEPQASSFALASIASVRFESHGHGAEGFQALGKRPVRRRRPSPLAGENSTFHHVSSRIFIFHHLVFHFQNIDDE